MEFRVEYDDDCVLTFEATTTRDALGFAADHAQPDSEFTLRSRRNFKVAAGRIDPLRLEDRKPWDEITRRSYWKVNYPGVPGSCRRVR